MEENSALASRGLAVMVEQVSMFMTTDNTVISFFEQSAYDIEKPILARLSSSSTAMRQSCDASMVVQAIIDAIIDMAMPVTSCYADVLGDLELDVLKRPRARDTQELYIIAQEINKMYGLLNPIQTLVKTLRDRAKLSQKATAKEHLNPHKGIRISSETYPYLSDVVRIWNVVTLRGIRLTVSPVRSLYLSHGGLGVIEAISREHGSTDI